MKGRRQTEVPLVLPRPHSYAQARIIAAEQGTSVSAPVKQFLANLARHGDESERFKPAEALLREGIKEFRAGDRLSRDELHRHER